MVPRPGNWSRRPASLRAPRLDPQPAARAGLWLLLLEVPYEVPEDVQTF